MDSHLKIMYVEKTEKEQTDPAAIKLKIDYMQLMLENQRMREVNKQFDEDFKRQDIDRKGQTAAIKLKIDYMQLMLENQRMRESSV